MIHLRRLIMARKVLRSLIDRFVRQNRISRKLSPLRFDNQRRTIYRLIASHLMTRITAKGGGRGGEKKRRRRKKMIASKRSSYPFSIPDVSSITRRTSPLNKHLHPAPTGVKQAGCKTCRFTLVSFSPFFSPTPRSVHRYRWISFPIPRTSDLKAWRAKFFIFFFISSSSSFLKKPT